MTARTFRAVYISGSIAILLLTSFSILLLDPPAAGTVQVSHHDRSFTPHQDAVNSVDWAANSTELVSGGTDGFARVWKWNHTNERSRYEETNERVLGVAWKPDRTSIATAWSDGRVRILNSNTLSNSQTLPHKSGPDNYIHDVCWHPNAGRLVSAGKDSKAKVWSDSSAQELTTFSGHSDDVYCVDYKPGGSQVCSGGNDNKIYIWDPSTGDQIKMLSGHFRGVRDVAWSPDGTKIASASDDSTARIWDAVTGSLLVQFTGHTDSVRSVDWSADGTKVVSGSADATFKIWDAESGHEYVNFTGHSHTVNCVAWSPDGDKIATASSDGSARIWILIAPPSKPVLTVEEEDVLRGEEVKIKGISEAYFTPAENLGVEFQYAVPGSSEWDDDYLASPEFANGKWEAVFSPDLDAPIGKYNFRVRFQELNDLLSEWSITRPLTVKNNLPTAILINVPTSAPRMETGFLSVKVEDLESEHEKMEIIPEYSRAVVEEWSDDIFGSSYYDGRNGLWKCNFTFPADSLLEFFRVRVCCKDPDEGYSLWHAPTDKYIMVKNKPPYITNLSFNPQQVYRTGKLTVWIDARDPEHGTDIDIPEVEIRSSRVGWSPLTVNRSSNGENFTVDHWTRKNDMLGYYDFRIKLEDRDLVDTDWFYYNESFEVMNNPPVAVGDYIKLELYNDPDRPEFFDLSEYASDVEERSDQLTWEIIDSQSLLFSPTMATNTLMTVTPSLSGQTGEGMVRFRVGDKDGDIDFKDIYVKLRDNSDAPIVGVFPDTPSLGTVVDDTEALLTWDTNSTDHPIYHVYLGESPDTMELIFTNEDTGKAQSSYRITGLFDLRTYYWKVTARFYDIPRTFESEIYHFTVDEGFIVKHDVEITLDETGIIEIGKGALVELNVTIKNKGNVEEILRLKNQPERGFSVNMDRTITVGVGEEVKVRVAVEWTGDDVGTRALWILAEPVSGDWDEVGAKATFHREKAATGGKDPLPPWVWVLMAMILIGGFGVVLVLVVWKTQKKKGAEELEPIPADMPIPGMIPSPVPGASPGPPGPGYPPGPPASSARTGPPGPQPFRPMPLEGMGSDIEEAGDEYPEPGASEEEGGAGPGKADRIRKEIEDTLGVLKALEGHKNALAESMSSMEDPGERAAAGQKIAAIGKQQADLQAKAIQLGEMAQRVVEKKELDNIFGAEKSLQDGRGEVKALPVAATRPARTRSMEDAGEAAGESFPDVTMTESEEKEAEPVDVFTKEGPDEVSEEMNVSEVVTDVETILNQCQEMINECKLSGFDIAALEEMKEKSREHLREGRLKESEDMAKETRIKLEEVLNTNLPEHLKVKIMELSGSVEKAGKYGLDVEDEADAVVVIKHLKDGGKYRDAIDALRGIQSSISGKLREREKQVRWDTISAAQIEIETLELEGMDITDLRELLANAKESVDIDDFEAADRYIEEFGNARETVSASARQADVEGTVPTAEEPAATTMAVDQPAATEAIAGESAQVQPQIQPIAPLEPLTQVQPSVPPTVLVETPTQVQTSVQPTVAGAPKRRKRVIRKVKKRVVKRRPETQ